jgi:tetratricopeptide (TPR) repeat protein
VGGSVGLLVLAGLLIRGAKLVFGPDMFAPRAEVAVAAPSATTVADASSQFISRAKAEQVHELALKSLRELRRMPSDHPLQLQQMILMEKALNEGEALLARHEFARAHQVLEGLKRDTDAFSENVKAKGEARKAYDAILLRIKDLEIARSLAPGSLEAAFEAAGAGRQLLTDGNFTGAKKVFDGAFAELRKAELALADHVRESLLAGQRALAKGDKPAAQLAFRAALEKSPGNDVALAGLKRAETIDRVHTLLQEAAKLEQAGRYADSGEAFRKAFALDGLSAVAQEGQARTARLDKDAKHAAAKAAADAALAAKDWPKAIAEYQAALKIYPQKPDIQALLKSARDSAHREAVQKALARGVEHEKVFQWKEARDAYAETLALEPNQVEAKEGYTRAGTVIRALLQYEKYIESAEQLAKKADFQGGIRRFNQAMEVKPAYLENSERVQQLHALLMAQNKPVEVTFSSDGDTWVSINNFRAPKKFDSEVIKMMPGDYQITGRRKGYRDVEIILQVRSDVTPPKVNVVCTVENAKT